MEDEEISKIIYVKILYHRDADRKLGSISFRAIETLKNVDLILCEDTRTTKHLLDKYNISKPTMSYLSDDIVGKNSRQSTKLEKIFELLEAGKNLALVSDAGTPGISDPGALLVSDRKRKIDLAPRPSPCQGEGLGVR